MDYTNNWYPARVLSIRSVKNRSHRVKKRLFNEAIELNAPKLDGDDAGLVEEAKRRQVVVRFYKACDFREEWDPKYDEWLSSHMVAKVGTFKRNYKRDVLGGMLTARQMRRLDELFGEVDARDDVDVRVHEDDEDDEDDDEDEDEDEDDEDDEEDEQ